MSSLMRRRMSAMVGSALVAMVLAVPAAGADGTAGPTAPTAGVVPPQDPPYLCAVDYKTNPLILINRCRKREGVGPMTLPSNYDSLTVPQQELVVYNLERISRGLPAIVGLNATLNDLAQTGANGNVDPDFPQDGTGDTGSIWATSQTVLGADYEWMYYDECTYYKLVGCWGHRDNILIDGDSSDPLVAGTAWKAKNFHGKGFTWNSYASEFMYGYHPDQLTFTWASELKYFDSPPAMESLGPPQVTSITKVVSTGGGQTILMSGKNFFARPTITVDGTPSTSVDCSDNAKSCTFKPPAHAAGTASVEVTTVDGVAAPVQVTYADPGLSRIGSETRTIKAGQCLYSVKALGTVNGVPTGGLHVTFSVTSGPALWQGGQPTDGTTTNGKGVVESVSLCDKGHQTGTGTVEATLPGVADPVTWTFTVT